MRASADFNVEGLLVSLTKSVSVLGDAEITETYEESNNKQPTLREVLNGVIPSCSL